MSSSLLRRPCFVVLACLVLASSSSLTSGNENSTSGNEQLQEAVEPEEDYPFEERLSDSTRVRSQYPDRVPVILLKAENSALPETSKTKFLLPGDLTVGQFMYIIRKDIQLPPEKALFVYVEKNPPPTSFLMAELDQIHKDDDGFLYITYTDDNTFAPNGKK